MNYLNKIIKKFKDRLFRSSKNIESPSVNQKTSPIVLKNNNSTNQITDIDNQISKNNEGSIEAKTVVKQVKKIKPQLSLEEKILTQENKVNADFNICPLEKKALISEITTLVSAISKQLNKKQINNLTVSIPQDASLPSALGVSETAESKDEASENCIDLEDSTISKPLPVIKNIEENDLTKTEYFSNNKQTLYSKQGENYPLETIKPEIISYVYRDGKEHILTMTNLTPSTDYIIEEEKHQPGLENNADKELNIAIKIENIPSKIQEPMQTAANSQTNSNTKANNPLDFLDENFESDLDKIINSTDFIERASKLAAVPNFKDNKEYISDYQSGEDMSEEALEMLVYANRQLVLKMVSRYKRLASPSFSEDDMFQHGMIGLLKAAKRFDLSKEFEFSTYAVHWIRQEITRGIMDQSNTIRVPVHMGERINKIRLMERKSFSNFGVVNYEWIALELELSLEKVIEAVQVKNTFMSKVSLDTPVGIEESTTLGDFIEDASIPSPDSQIMDESLQSIIFSLLEELRPRERDIIIKRFGLDGKGRRTLETIGKDHDVTRERIRQIEKKALTRLQQPSRSNQLKEYYEVI